MILHVKDAKYLHDYVIWVKFNDGIKGEIDLENELTGAIFGPIKDKKLFPSILIPPLARYESNSERFCYVA